MYTKLIKRSNRKVRDELIKIYLRALALLGLILPLAVDIFSSDPWVDRQGYSIWVLWPTFLVAAASMLFLLKNATLKLFHHLDLLVPLGICTLAIRTLWWGLSIPALSALSVTSDWNIFGLALSISLGFIISIFIYVAYSVWTLTLICNTIQGRPIHLLDNLTHLPQRYGKTFGYSAIVTVLLFISTATAILFSTFSMILASLIIGAVSVGLNIATAGLLLRGVARPQESFLVGLKEGYRISLAHLRKWVVPVGVQLFLLGLVTYASVSYTYPGGSRSAWNWGINGFWVGGFQDQSHWLSHVMNLVEVPAPTVIASLLAILLGIFAIVLKLHIAQALHEENALGNRPLPRKEGDESDQARDSE